MDIPFLEEMPSLPACNTDYDLIGRNYSLVVVTNTKTSFMANCI